MRTLPLRALRGIAAVFGLLACLMLAGETSARAARPYLTNVEYSLDIASVASAAADAAAGKAGAAMESIDRLKPILRCPVLAAPGDLVFVDNRPLLAQMQTAELVTDATQHRAAWARIDAQLTDLAAHLGPVSSPDVTAIARGILSRSEFVSDPLPGKSLWERMAEWIERELKKTHINIKWPHFSAPSTQFKVSPLLPEGILIVLLVAILALVIYQTALWWRRSAGQRVAAPGMSDLAVSLQERALVEAQDYLGLESLAARAAESGDYRSAVRLTFLSLLVYLNSGGIVILDRSKTNWEYMRDVRRVGRIDIEALIAPLVYKFDLVWYGDRPATRDDYELARQTLSSVRSNAGSSATGTALAGASQR